MHSLKVDNIFITLITVFNTKHLNARYVVVLTDIHNEL